MDGEPDVEHATLRDGVEVVIRPLVPTDAATLRAGMALLSDDARFRRFLTGKSELTPSELEYLSTPDGIDHVAFGAADPARQGEDRNPAGLGIGTARYVRSRTDPDTAEFAVTVIDEYQRRGVATLLLDRLSEHARRQGIVRLTGEALADNVPVAELVRARGGRVDPIPEDRSVVSVELPLGDAPLDGSASVGS